MSEEYIYALRYQWNTEFRKEGYKKEDQLAVDYGLCDAFMFVSVLLPPDGSYSQMIISSNGKTQQPMTDKEKFKVWMTLGLSLADEGKLKGWHKQMVDMMAKMVRKMFGRSK